MRRAVRWLGCLLIIAPVVGCTLQWPQNADPTEAVPTLQAHLLTVGSARGELDTFPPLGPWREVSNIDRVRSSLNAYGSHPLADPAESDMLAVALMRRSP